MDNAASLIKYFMCLMRLTLFCCKLLNLGLKDKYTEGTKQLGFSLEDLLSKERDAALGNGGLGRLAACYLDSSASQELPVWGFVRSRGICLLI